MIWLVNLVYRVRKTLLEGRRQWVHGKQTSSSEDKLHCILTHIACDIARVTRLWYI